MLAASASPRRHVPLMKNILMFFKKVCSRVITSFFALILGFSAAADAFAESYYRTVKLPRSVTVMLPFNWKVVSDNQRATIGAFVESAIEKTGMLNATSEYAFGANLFDDAGKVSSMMNIRYYPELPVGQDLVTEFTAVDVLDIDKMLEKSIRAGGQSAGYQILQWRGTRKVVVNGYTMLLSEYKRGPLKNNGNFVVRLARILNGPKSFTITVSYREDDEIFLRPIGDKIISSIQP